MQSFKDLLLHRTASRAEHKIFHLARLAGTAPKAILYNRTTTKVALGAVVMRVPAVTDFDRDPLEIIETGDWVKVDGDRGVVEITKRTA